MPMAKCTRILLPVRRAAVTVIFLLAIPVASLGCSYYSYPNPPTEYIVSRTRTIFLGTLLQKTFRTRKDEAYKYRVHTLTLRIEQALKGEQGGAYRIEYWEKISRRDSCDEKPPDPKVGKRWVIFHGYDEGDDDTLLYVRNPEWLSWRYEPDERRSQVELKEIKDAIAFPRSSFFGEVEMAMLDTPPSDGRKLIAELLNTDGSFVIRTVTVENGRFSFPNLEPENYTVRLRSSKQERLLYPEQLTMRKDEGIPPYFADFKVQVRPKLPEFRSFALDAF